MRIDQWMYATALIASLAFVALAQSTQSANQRVSEAGTLIRVDGARLVIQPAWQPPDATPVVVATDEQTRVILDIIPSTLDKLQPGMDMTVRREAPTQPAPHPPLIVAAWSPSSTGLITRVEGMAIHLKPTRSGTEPASSVVQTDRDTKIVRVASLVGDTWDEGGPITLDELKPDMLVRAMPPKGVASKVFVWPARVRNAATTAPASDR
jgi:hypothetical protein